MIRSVKLLLSTILVSLVSFPINSQQLEEVLVTAQKREQDLQDVPISILAISGVDIEAGGFSDMEDMSVFVPSLFMSDSLTGQNLVIRGVGTTVANEAFEQAVAQFHDGVYYGRDNLGQNSFFDLERVEVVRGPSPVFAGQSATAGALSYISRRPGDSWEGRASLALGSDEEFTWDAAYGGPVSDTFSVRLSGRYYELNDAGYEHVITGEELGTKENWAARFLGVWTPNDDFELTLKFEHHDVSQNGVPREYTRCETRPALSTSHMPVAPFIGALCALDAAVNGIDLNRLDGIAASGGSLDVREEMDKLNAASGAFPGDPNYWGAPWSPVSYGLNAAREFNEDERREQDVDVALLAFDWDINGSGVVLSSTTSYVEYDKHDWLDPDQSTFAIFVGERGEDFEQFAQEIRLTSPEDQQFSWMVGAYYQDHDLTTQIDVHLPWNFDIPAFLFGAPPNPLSVGTLAVSFGGPLVENSTWTSLFFNTTFNASDNFRINVGGRYVDIEKDGTENPEISFFVPGATEFGPHMPLGPPVSGTADTSEFMPQVGFQWDVSENTMFYVKYSEAIKAGGFVKSPPIGGAVPNPFSYEPEEAEGIEIGLKALLLDGRLALNLAAFDTDFSDLQVTVFVAETGQFITTNAAESHTKGIEFDGRWAVTDNFSFTFAGNFTEAEYDKYNGAPCNSLVTKQNALAITGNPFAPVPCFIDGSGETLPFSPEWSFNLSPEYRFTMGNYNVTATLNMMFSDGYGMFGIDGDPLNKIDSWERVDLRIAMSPPDGSWTIALYGRDITDEQLQHTNAYSFLSKSLDMIHDANGVGRDRGARYGIQLSYAF